MIALSIIVPVYNKENYLDRCIQSILLQTFSDFELIIINDGSTDSSRDICEYYKNIDDRITLIHQLNSGASSARNVGLSLAKGYYIGFIDSDDTIEPDMFGLLIENASYYGADISACRIRVYFPNKIYTPKESDVPVLLDNNQALSAFLTGGLDMSANNKIYKSELLKGVMFEGVFNEDILFGSKVFIRSKLTVVQNKIKYNYIVRENSTSMSIFNDKYMEIITVSSKIVQLISKYNDICLPEAKSWDITANISILNMILVSNKNNFPTQYALVVKNLKAHEYFIYNSNLIKRKHKYAYSIFLISPKLYFFLMYSYCKLCKSNIFK